MTWYLYCCLLLKFTCTELTPAVKLLIDWPKTLSLSLTEQQHKTYRIVLQTLHKLVVLVQKQDSGTCHTKILAHVRKKFCPTIITKTFCSTINIRHFWKHVHSNSLNNKSSIQHNFFTCTFLLSNNLSTIFFLTIIESQHFVKHMSC